MNTSRVRTALVAITTAALVMAATPATASPTDRSAEPPPPAPSATAEVRDLADLPDDLPDGATVAQFGTGSYVVALPGSTATPAEPLSVGVGRTIYIYLNRTEQSMLANGGAAGLAALACATGGIAVCVGVSAALAAAATWVNRNGFYPSRLEIAVARGYKCVR